MTDIKSVEERSSNMALIKSKDTKPEVWLRKELFRRGYRYRTNSDKIFGHPDLWLAKYNTAIFVHGCFWHRHQGCKYCYTPKSQVDFWKSKFERNVERDEYVRRELTKEKIKLLIVWECTIKKMVKADDIKNEKMNAIEAFLNDSSPFCEL